MPGSVILATASYDHTIRFWEAHTGKCKAFVQHPESVQNKTIVLILILSAVD
jgi:G protein beta subunit-like protein